MRKEISMSILHRHKHQWDEVIYIHQNEHQIVQYCDQCGEARSFIRDVRTNKECWIPYDIWGRSDVVYVVCDDPLQFEAIKKVHQQEGGQHLYRLTDINVLYGHTKPIILFAGRWWEQEIVQDPRFTHFLNYGRL